MKINDIFEIENLECLEPTLNDHTETGYTGMTLSLDADDARLLIDEEENPVAIAVHEKDGGWLVSSFLYRPFSLGILEFFEEFGSDIYQENRNTCLFALREYYCNDILNEFPSVIEDNRPGRYEMIKSLLDQTGWDGKGKTALDFCCGSGVATSVLRDKGFETLSFDNDAGLISRGIQSGRLLPDYSMCIDASCASVFCPDADFGIGLMLGDITAFNSHIWEGISAEIFGLCENVLISTATEPEIKRIEGWCRDSGRKAEIFSNDRDPIYDAWVCLSEGF
ncbi:class I SAM-dependent methyltransferase [Methanoplanus sp. FWC-SCC4]|uniref:Class I SAM-dependent methyltransferase n=1 Tax=Methanochimaera problematica TaxID=2609417 RepID=A0AA97FDJ6_9EURY|nr:hypothetical protein [Methanoplanus sp. FWC-SCC4]WOF16562.1 class I SAM-dependent methyltransferase [Methanoplanus sp. FWC-SCC4]